MSYKEFFSFDERGGAPTLVVFAIFIVISTSIALTYFQTTERRGISAIQQRTAADVTRAKVSSIDSELTGALQSGIRAAEWEIGMAGGSLEEVEDLIIEYLNNRISKGWTQTNIEITIPLIEENDLTFEWQPDGSLTVRGYLENAKFEHVTGPTVYGLELEASTIPRFQRLKYIAESINKKYKNVSDLSGLENNLNDNYACEGIRIHIKEINNELSFELEDIYGAESVILD
ncbi:MAG: hypothetical protein KGY45_03275 [Hadesarchaea archaeon]|nr:hypothetical protein [Hadesarchaea archaeon]